MSTDLDRGGVMALARVPIDSLLGPRLTLHFVSAGAFAGPGFSGTRGGAFDVTLTRGRLAADTSRITLYPGDSVG
ncbi:MAG: hypothetical protein ACJ786_03400 [Catenulispora sp.]